MLTFSFKLHDETRNSKQVGEISETLINHIDKFLKKTQLHQMVTYFKKALALLIATRMYISPFDNEKFWICFLR